MKSINFSKPYIDLTEVDRIIELAHEIPEFQSLMDNFKDARILFAREQYNKNAISVWNLKNKGPKRDNL